MNLTTIFVVVDVTRAVSVNSFKLFGLLVPLDEVLSALLAVDLEEVGVEVG